MASLIKRKNVYYIQYCISGKVRRVSTGTDCRQLAKEKLRHYESDQFRGIDNPLPTRTPIAEVLAAYVEHIRMVKTAKSAQADCYYLREMFGPVCPALEVVSRKPSPLAKKRPPSRGRIDAAALRSLKRDTLNMPQTKPGHSGPAGDTIHAGS